MDYEKWAECWALWSLVRTICSEWLKAFYPFGKESKEAWCSSLVIHERWSVAEVKWWEPDLAHSNWFIRACVDFPPKAHMHSDAQRVERACVTSQEEQSAWGILRQVSWGIARLREMISSHFFASFWVPQRLCLLGTSLPSSGIIALWKICSLQMIKNKLA